MACSILPPVILLQATVALEACCASKMRLSWLSMSCNLSAAGCELCYSTGQLLSMTCCAVTSMIALRSSSGPSRMSSCWVTAPTQCSPTWGKVAAWPLRTPTSWPRTCTKRLRPSRSPGSTWKGSLWYDLDPIVQSQYFHTIMYVNAVQAFMTCAKGCQALISHVVLCDCCTSQDRLCTVCSKSVSRTCFKDVLVP